ncbi:MAG: recombinase family protein, partial [Chroococcales cyanobacterium]
PLNEQRSLRGSPLIRALLTLLSLIYPGLGRLVDKDSVAEMLVVLSQKPDQQQPERNIPEIDPVRAGLIADHCFSPTIDDPGLLSVEAFPRWDRLGQKATKAYLEIKHWIEQMRQRSQQESPPKIPQVLEKAIHSFLWNGSNLSYEQLSILRELMETAQHYWEVERRLQTDLENPQEWTKAIANFILLLRGGTITANAYPLHSLGEMNQNAVTLATIYQYRSIRRSHRWQFWLDIASPFWLTGGSGLFGAPLFLKSWSGQPLSPNDQLEADEERLKRVMRDLLGRVTEQVYLCHSDLAVNGTEQTGLLLSLVHASIPYTATLVQ